MCRNAVPGYPGCDEDHGEPSSSRSPQSILQGEDERWKRIVPWIIDEATNPDELSAFRVTSRSLLHTKLWNAVHDYTWLSELLNEAHRSIDERWSYQHEREGDYEYISCNGPGERTELSMVEARWHLRLILQMPPGATVKDLRAAMVADNARLNATMQGDQ